MTLSNSTRSPYVLPTILALGFLAGCVTSSDRTGVENRWRADSIPTFETGVTTRTEVLEALGPPSQLIRIDDGMVMYYLTEESDETTYILLIFNYTKGKTQYDRAIFFFDDQGVLTEFATSPGSLEYDGDD